MNDQWTPQWPCDPQFENAPYSMFTSLIHCDQSVQRLAVNSSDMDLALSTTQLTRLLNYSQHMTAPPPNPDPSLNSSIFITRSSLSFASPFLLVS